MFVDSIELTLRAGNGGNGVASFRREKYIPKGGPDGGNGGKGGSIWLEVSPNVHSLDHLSNRPIIKAKRGMDGSSGKKKGKDGPDITVKVPLGTLIFDAHTDELLYDLDEKGQTILMCEGGRYGIGNVAFATPTRKAPHHHTMGKPGEEKKVRLELKSIADVGFVGFPNAGKSTLLNALAQRDVKVANYPFTTLQPNLGIAQFNDFSTICFADIPGIIEKASEDKGLGLSFLKHIERCNVLLFVLDASQEDFAEDLEILQKELAHYKKSLLDKPYFVALNKADLVEDPAQLKKEIPLPEDRIFVISAQDKQGLLDLAIEIRAHLPTERLFQQA